LSYLDVGRPAYDIIYLSLYSLFVPLYLLIVRAIFEYFSAITVECQVLVSFVRVSLIVTGIASLEFKDIWSFQCSGFLIPMFAALIFAFVSAVCEEPKRDLASFRVLYSGLKVSM
jgi:phosphoglycerol transferase MdoB-like AlkP superfamily enzyme